MIKLTDLLDEAFISDLSRDYSKWEQKHPILNLTWDEIREIVKQVVKHGVHGTPGAIRSNKVNRAIISVQMSNLPEKLATNELGREVAKAFSQQSGRKVTFRGWSYTSGETIYEPGRSAVNPHTGGFDYSHHKTWKTKDIGRFEFLDTSTGQLG